MVKTEPEFRCPMCSSPAPDKIVLGVGGELLGCDQCLTLQDGADWFREHEENLRRITNDWGWV